MIVGEEEEFLQQNKLFKELEKGHQYALQLMNMLASPSDDEGIESQRILVDAVIRSFESAITNLRLHDGCEKMAGSQGCHVSSDCPDKENVEMIVRGCNKKRNRFLEKKNIAGFAAATVLALGLVLVGLRKITQPQIAATSTISNHTEDGYAWRKYGQKEILGSKFPRSYFRCTHKSDQGCPAIRQVQRLDHNPSLMQITYMGIHTCTPIRANTELATESCESPEFLLNFETKSMTSGSQLSSFPFLEKEDANEKLLRTESTPSCRWAGRFSSGDFGTTGSFDLLKELRYIGLNAGDVGPAECTFPGLDMGLASFSQLGELHHGGSASA